MLLFALPSFSLADEQAFPVAAFFRHPLATDLVISPKGKYYPAIIAVSGDQFLAVTEILGRTTKPLLKTADPDFRIARVLWGNDDLLLISASIKSKTAVRVRARHTAVLAAAGRRANAEVSRREVARGRAQSVSGSVSQPA